MKKLFLLIIFLLTFSLNCLAEDTGTYRILDYTITLTPKSDGLVQMDYYMKWKVETGHIPWITVGTANNEFAMIDYGNNVSKIAAESSSGFEGVRIDLDKDYQPGETFEVKFSISQNKLFEADKENYKLSYTPGWYDRAYTDHLAITMKFFAEIDKVTFDPEPGVKTEDTATWDKTNLGEGERVDVSISFPKVSFSTPIADTNLKQGLSNGMIFLIFIIIFFIIVIFIAWVTSDSDGYGGGGSIFYGGSGGGGGIGSGGGGGFGGRSSGCVSSCVSCACACACAGGGGAGCTKKNRHTCPVCKKLEEKIDKEST